jgi:hypothetical protein
MTGRIVPRLGAISGLLYFVVIVAGSSFGSTDNARRIELIGMLFFLPFLGYLWGVLRRAEGADGWLSMTALGAGLAAFIVKIASAAPLLAADNEAQSGHLHDALVSVNDISFIVTMLPLGVFAAAVATVTLKTGALPRWLGWFATVTAPALVVNGLFFGSTEGPAFLLFLVWLVATSIVLTLRAGDSSADATAPQPLTA